MDILRCRSWVLFQQTRLEAHEKTADLRRKMYRDEYLLALANDKHLKLESNRAMGMQNQATDRP